MDVRPCRHTSIRPVEKYYPHRGGAVSRQRWAHSRQVSVFLSRMLGTSIYYSLWMTVSRAGGTWPVVFPALACNRHSCLEIYSPSPSQRSSVAIYPSYCPYYCHFTVIMKAFFVLALTAFAAAGPLCTSSTSSAAPVATPKSKTCNRICGDEKLVCTSPWVRLLWLLVAGWNGRANA